jgi:DNA-binding LacI/PurR family transcriptional regulator
MAQTGWEKSWGQTPVTLKDVAERAGVSISAASVAVNGTRSGTRISDEKKTSILEVATTLGYRPNGLARALVRGRSSMVGIYSGGSRIDARNYFFAELLGGVMGAARGFGLNTAIHSSGSERHHILELLSSRAVDGLILHRGINDPILSLLHDLRIPAVAIADEHADLPSVVVDDQAGGFLQARHLAALGHKHVLFKVRVDYLGGSAANRLQAFKDEAARLGIKVTEHPETLGVDDGLDLHDVEILTKCESPATAIVAWSDAVAYRVCRKLGELGISIPSQVAVVGFDGTALAFEPKYHLTTIRAPWDHVGRVATEFLCELIAGKPVPKITTLPVTFSRGTTT